MRCIVMAAKSEFPSRFPSFQQQTPVSGRQPWSFDVEPLCVIAAGLCRLIQTQKSILTSLKQKTHITGWAIAFSAYSQSAMCKTAELQEESM